MASTRSGKYLRDALTKAFPQLAKSQVSALAKETTRTASYTTGETVLREGATANAFYVITSGEADAVQLDPKGREVGLRRMKPGDYFGEVGLLEEARRTATVRARTPLEVVVLDRDQFEGLVGAPGDTAATVRKTARKRAAHDAPGSARGQAKPK